MKFIAAPQGTPEWHIARCGKATASRFSDAVSMVGALTDQQAIYVKQVLAGCEPKEAAVAAGYKALPTSDCVRRALAGERTEEFSDIARRYSCDLSIERVSGKPFGEPARAWVLERGHIMEARARMAYEAYTRAFVTESGVCVDQSDWYGYSTDGLVENDGLIEIKAPIDSAKIIAMLQTGDVSEYLHQMMGGLWLTGRAWCDFIMYVPDLEPVGKDLFIKRIYRDDVFIDAMVERLYEFQKMTMQYESILRLPGVGVEQKQAPAAVASNAPSWRDQFLNQQ